MKNEYTITTQVIQILETSRSHLQHYLRSVTLTSLIILRCRFAHEFLCVMRANRSLVSFFFSKNFFLFFKLVNLQYISRRLFPLFCTYSYHLNEWPLYHILIKDLILVVCFGFQVQFGQHHWWIIHCSSFHGQGPCSRHQELHDLA